MRSILVSVGPYEWPAVLVIAAVLVVAVLAWRRLERHMGEEPGPVTPLWAVVTGALIIVAAVLLWLAINKLAPLHIRSYGVMLLLGFTAGILYLSRVGPSRGFSVAASIDLALLILVLSVVGARVIFVLLLLDEYAREPETVMDVWQGGLSFHGGVLGGVVAVIIFCKRRKVRFSVLSDLVAPAVPLGYAFTRIGCFLNGCCHGHASDLPWAVVFPENIQRFPMPVHPTQLYAAAGSIVIFVLLVKLWPRMHRPGQLFPVYLVVYSALRFGMEFTRRGASADPFPLLPELTVAQAACILIAAAGVVWFLILQRKPYENPLTASVLLEEIAPAPQVDEDAEGNAGRRRRRRDM